MSEKRKMGKTWILWIFGGAIGGSMAPLAPSKYALGQPAWFLGLDVTTTSPRFLKPFTSRSDFRFARGSRTRHWCGSAYTVQPLATWSTSVYQLPPLNVVSTCDRCCLIHCWVLARRRVSTSRRRRVSLACLLLMSAQVAAAVYRSCCYKLRQSRQIYVIWCCEDVGLGVCFTSTGLLQLTLTDVAARLVSRTRRHDQIMQVLHQLNYTVRHKKTHQKFFIITSTILDRFW